MAKEEIFGSFGLVQGISLLAFGLFFVMKPEVIAMFFGTILAIVIIIDGILKLQYGIEFYHMKADKWWIEAVVAAFMVVMGVIALFNPFDSMQKALEYSIKRFQKIKSEYLKGKYKRFYYPFKFNIGKTKPSFSGFINLFK